jgi:eukaryotic-like serine/threonine-protein kinase
MDALAQLNSSLAGRYAIEREIGRGGMATVYLARDVKHDRRVALKVLNPELGAVLGVERFLSEIRVTANLQHPNLLPLFDSGEADGLLFYVMPLVEGESLRAKLVREKQLPIEEAVRISTAIAGALDYAHRHGVIHRDLKPENILLHDDQPLIADFGIALAVSNAGGERVTQTGLSLGTPQYMSPEQATGDRGIDGRTDIYSLGAITYEMLAGEPPHVGSTAQAIIARLMTEDPRPLTVARRSVPLYMNDAVQRALEKLPADRFVTAHEFAEALQGRAQAVTATSSRSPVGVPPRGRAPLWAAAFALLAALAMLAALWEWRLLTREQPGLTVRFAPSLPAGTRLVMGTAWGHGVAISPNGKYVAFTRFGSAGTALSVRASDQLESHPVSGTDGAGQPFFSPDGEWIGFFVGSQLKKVSLDGRVVVPIADLGRTKFGATWTRDGRIVVALDGKLVAVEASGGAVRDITPKARWSSRWPMALDDGKTVLVTAWTTAVSSSRIFAVSVDDGHTQDLGLPGNSPLGVIDGNLIYANGAGALMAVPFDEHRLGATRGSAALVLDQVAIGATGASRAALSASGSLVYQTGGGAQQVVLADAKGAVRPLVPQARNYAQARFSPDGRRIALTVESGTSMDIQIYEIATGTLTRLTTEGATNDRPEWSPDGHRVLFRSDRMANVNSLWWQPIDASGPAERLVGGGPVDVWEGVIAPDGNTLLYRTGTYGTADIWTRQLNGDTTAKPFVQTPFIEWSPRFSPDGKWVAYASDESGSFQIYVKPFPGPGPRVPVSVDGGETPLWSRDGHRLFYVKDQQAVIAATVTLSPTFAVRTQQTFLEGDFAFNPGHASYDVTPDGKELLLLKPVAGDSPLIIAAGWRYEVRERLAAKSSK